MSAKRPRVQDRYERFHQYLARHPVQRWGFYVLAMLVVSPPLMVIDLTWEMGRAAYGVFLDRCAQWWRFYAASKELAVYGIERCRDRAQAEARRAREERRERDRDAYSKPARPWSDVQ